MKKKVLHQMALALIVTYFLFDAVQKLLSQSRDVYKSNLSHKVRQMETSLDNNHLLLFPFSWLIEEFASLIILIHGLAQLIFAVAFYFYDDENERRLPAIALVGLLVFDALVVHCPFTEEWHNMGRELDHFSCNIGLAAGLCMVLGFRDYA